MADTREKTTRDKALKYLRDEDVRITHASSPPGGTRPDEVRARVRGHRAFYFVRMSEGVWSCTCAQGLCAHAAAVQMVTGYLSPASKPAKASGKAA